MPRRCALKQVFFLQYNHISLTAVSVFTSVWASIIGNQSCLQTIFDMSPVIQQNLALSWLARFLFENQNDFFFKKILTSGISRPEISRCCRTKGRHRRAAVKSHLGGCFQAYFSFSLLFDQTPFLFCDKYPFLHFDAVLQGRSCLKIADCLLCKVDNYEKAHSKFWYMSRELLKICLKLGITAK